MGLVGTLMVAAAFVTAQAREIPHASDAAQARLEAALPAPGSGEGDPGGPPVAPSAAAFVTGNATHLSLPPTPPPVAASAAASSMPAASAPRRARPDLRALYDRRH
jgi:hypothetical protein